MILAAKMVVFRSAHIRILFKKGHIMFYKLYNFFVHKVEYTI